FTRAQRLAPKSSAVYFYLAQVALKKNQPRKAEAMARRGLSVSQDASRRRALWQIILQSGQAQGNSRVVSEARRALR
ncbi:MAG: tetratricopeptide repeat protein, partial [Psychrobacter sp.]